MAFGDPRPGRPTWLGIWPQELKLMAMGLLSGIRALIWAIVLLMAPWSEGPVDNFLALKKCWFVVGLVGSNLNRGMPPASFQGCVGCERRDMLRRGSCKVVIYTISIITKSFFGDTHIEFSTVGVAT